MLGFFCTFSRYSQSREKRVPIRVLKRLYECNKFVPAIQFSFLTFSTAIRTKLTGRESIELVKTTIGANLLHVARVTELTGLQLETSERPRYSWDILFN